VSRLRARWAATMLAPAPPVRLAVVRILTGLFALWYICKYDRWLSEFEGLSARVFAPIGLTSHLHAPLPDATVMALGIATTVAGVLFTLGLLWRLSGPAFALLLLYTMTYRNSWSMVFHHENMLVLHVLILGFLPAAGVLAIDPWLRRRWPRLGWMGATPALDPQPRWQIGWGLKLLQIGATVPYVVAGVAKVNGKAGWAWALGDNLRDQVLMNGIYYELLMGGAKAITAVSIHWTWAWVLLAAGTLVLEFGAPLALLGGRWAVGVVVGLIGLHWGILWIMGIHFDYQLFGVAFACFVPWERLARLSRRSPRPHPAGTGSHLRES